MSEAANHANEAMKKIDQLKQLLDIQESVGGVVDLVSPTREFIKEGKLMKISARSGDHHDRYLFLVNRHQLNISLSHNSYRNLINLNCYLFFDHKL